MRERVEQRCERCGEEERLGTWCGACGALLEDVDGGPTTRSRRTAWVVTATVLVLLVGTLVALVVAGVIDPADLGR